MHAQDTCNNRTSVNKFGMVIAHSLLYFLCDYAPVQIFRGSEGTNPVVIKEEQSDDSDSDDTLPVVNLSVTSPGTSTCPSQVSLWIMCCTYHSVQI